MNKLLHLILGLLCLQFQLSYALDIPELSSPVVDNAGLLSNHFKSTLTRTLFNIRNQYGSEVAVLTIKSLDGDSIEGYSIRVAEKWKLGSSEKDNGILFLIALDDRKMRIEVGQGHEGDLPDLAAARIIREVTEYFKRSDYQSGITIGVKRIVESIGIPSNKLPKISRKRSKHKWGMIIFLIFLLIVFFSGRGGKGGLLWLIFNGTNHNPHHTSWGEGSIVNNGDLGPRRGRRFGGGSFGGGSFGGGGGFSGGGASGGW